jgi:hypothetical protein
MALKIVKMLNFVMYAYFTIEKSLKKVDCGLGVVFRRLID